MTNLDDMKVSTKLSLGFGGIVLLLIAVVTVATLRIQSINGHVTEIVRDRAVKVELSMDLDQATNVQARNLRNAIIGSKDPDEVRSSLEQVDKAVAEVAELLAKLDKMINTPKGSALMKTMAETSDRYAAGRTEVVRLIKDGKVDEAGAHLLKAVRPAQTDFFAAIESMIAFQKGIMENSAKEAEADGAAAIRTTLAIAVVAVLLAIGAAVVITRSLTRQLGGEPGDVVRITREVADGNLAVDIPVQAGDSTSIVAAMAAMRDRLADVVGQVRQSSDSIATGSAQIATGNADLSQRTEEQASNLQQTAASMEELAGTVKSNADTAQQADRLAGEAAAAAARGGEVVGQVVATMQDISASSKKIADIIGTIDGIAFQTNILALNAAVEAARAGEQGRGFAVVASEVRSLAQRSANAAKEIKSLIGASVEKVEAGTRQVNEAGTSMDDIVAQVQRVNALISEISAATSEQSTGIGQVGDAVTQLDQVTQQNAALVEESAAAAESLKQQAERLTQVVAQFRLSGGGASYHAPIKTPALVRPVSKSPVVKKSAPSVLADRRGPNRAKNVVRPDFTAPAAAKAPAAEPAVAQAATGTNDDWETF